MSSHDSAPARTPPVPVRLAHVRSGVLLGSLVFAAFAAYAYLAPATYRTSALLVVEPPSGAAQGRVPEPLEAARRLREAVLDRVLLDELARARAGSDDPEQRVKASHLVRNALEIDTSDGRTFSVAYADSDRERVQHACAALARRAVERAPTALAPERAPEEQALELKRRQATQELASFLSAHPELAASAAPPTPERDALSAEASDPQMIALNSERARLMQLSKDAVAKDSDNPYVEQRDRTLNADQIKRRIAELDGLIYSRHQALQAKTPPSTVKPPPELGAELARLVKAVAEGGAPAPRPAPPTARILAEATVPDSPSEPNRPRLLIVGALMALGLGGLWTISRGLLARTAQPRRGRGSDAPARAVPATEPQPGPKALLTERSAGARSSSSMRVAAAAPVAGGDSASAGRIMAVAVTGSSSSPPADGAFDPARLRIPGFAVVRANATESATTPTGPPAAERDSARAVEVSPIVRPVEGRRRTPQRGQVSKVTMPLGSLVPEGPWSDPRHQTPPPAGRRSGSSRPPAGASHSSVPPHRTPVPPNRTPVPPNRTPVPNSDTGYSYVSKPPEPAVAAAAQTPSSASASSSSPERVVVKPTAVPAGWRPDLALLPETRRALCEKLYPFAVERCFVLVVAATEDHEAKSRVACEIGLALAESGHPRVLVMEGDFHRPSVHRWLRVSMPLGAGFSQQMNARIHSEEEARWRVVECTKSLHVLAEGMMRSPGLLLSQQFDETMRDLRSYYDLIVIDGPTTSLDVDSRALDAVSDGLVIIGPENPGAAVQRVRSLFSEKRFTTVLAG